MKVEWGHLAYANVNNDSDTIKKKKKKKMLMNCDKRFNPYTTWCRR